MNYLKRGFGLIWQPGLRLYVLVPLLINVLVFSGLFYWGYSAIAFWLDGFMTDLPEWLDFLYWLIWVLAALTGLLVLFFCFTVVANLIASPFNAILSEKVEERLTGYIKPGMDFGSLLLILPRTFSREIAKLLYYLPRLLVVVIISFLPGVNFLAPLAWLVFGAWMMSVQYTDFGADNNQLPFRELRDRLALNRMASLEFGLVVYLMQAIPLLNLLVIPAAVAGGTVFWVERLSE